jgi:GNAT superfamily N-acetyltransferase
VFCGIELAARIERAEAQLIAACSDAARARWPDGFARPIAGGVASFAAPGSPYNKVAGLGFAGVPAEAELAGVERAFAACASPVQVELSELAEPALGGLLTDRGYRLDGFENVLGRGLRDLPAPVDGIEVRRSGPDELEAWLDVVVDAGVVSDEQGVPSHEDFPRQIIADALRDFFAGADGVLRYSALRDGVLAGGASIRLAGGVAQMAGAATAPAHRRRGVQSALLAARLADAADAGCDIAVVTTQPGSKSHENVQRQGFDLLYARAVLVSRPAGPSP